MKKTLPILKIILLIVFCSGLSSCLSVDRKIKINKDGSGEEVMKITLMKEFYALMTSMTEIMDSTRKEAFLDSLYNDQIFLSKTREEYNSIPGVTITDIYSQKNLDSSNMFVIKYNFDSLSKLGSAMEKAVKDEDDSNKGSVKENPTIVTMVSSGDEVLFNYMYEQPSDNPLSGEDSLTEQMKTGISEMFGSGSVSFEIEFPYDVVSSNASSTSGNTLTWYYPMTEVFMTPKMMLEAKMKR